MPSSFSHAVASVALGRSYTTQKLPARFWVFSIACSLAPDIDVECTRFGIDYGALLGHRGLTHSLFFAALLSALIVLLAFRTPIPGISRRGLLVYFFVVTVSHGVLDAMVNGTLGVAFFAPFDSTRYFLPWRPIRSSPIGLDFFGSTGATVILNELVWVWIPSLTIIFAPWIRRVLLANSWKQLRVPSEPEPATVASQDNG